MSTMFVYLKVFVKEQSRLRSHHTCDLSLCIVYNGVLFRHI